MKKKLYSLLVALCFLMTASALPSYAHRHPQAPAVIFDTDADFDDTVALSATNNRLVEYRWKRIEVIQDGVSSGRTIESATGDLMRVGVRADTALFERALLNALNGNASRH